MSAPGARQACKGSSGFLDLDAEPGADQSANLEQAGRLDALDALALDRAAPMPSTRASPCYWHKSLILIHV
jgi:hypothetical protein